MEFISINSDNVSHRARELKKKRCFIKFWMDGCGHCIQMAPEWEKMKKQLAKERSATGETVAIVDIDAPASSKLPLGAKVVGFPTIMHTLNGTHLETYSGERTAPAMKTWVLSNLDPQGPKGSSAKPRTRGRTKRRNTRRSGKKKRRRTKRKRR